jgi:hypothetical protein
MNDPTIQPSPPTYSSLRLARYFLAFLALGASLSAFADLLYGPDADQSRWMWGGRIVLAAFASAVVWRQVWSLRPRENQRHST